MLEVAELLQRRVERLTACAVKQPIPNLDRIVHSVRTCSVVHLPQTEAYLWHLMAAVEFDVWRSHVY
jgi:hypothetical protein